MCTLTEAKGGDYKGDGEDTSPQHFGAGGAKVSVPPPLIAHLVKFLGHSLQNAYLGEELKGFCIIKIQFLFSFRGAVPLDPGGGSDPRHPHHSEEIATTDRGDVMIANAILLRSLRTICINCKYS